MFHKRLDKSMEIKTIEDAQTLHNYILKALDCPFWQIYEYDFENEQQSYYYNNDFDLIKTYVELPKLQVLGIYEDLAKIADEDEWRTLEWLDHYPFEDCGCEYADMETSKIEISYDEEEVRDMCESDINIVQDFLEDIERTTYEAFGELVNYAIANKVIEEDDDVLYFYDSKEWEKMWNNFTKWKVTRFAEHREYIKEVLNELEKRMTTNKEN